MIKIRPITAQINTQKFISNFSSLLARAGVASAQSSRGRPLGPPAPQNRLLPLPVGSGSLLPRNSPATPGVVQVPPPEGPSPTRGCCTRGVGGQEKVGMEMETSQRFALLEPENSTKREVSHPHAADAPLEAKG